MNSDFQDIFFAVRIIFFPFCNVTVDWKAFMRVHLTYIITWQSFHSYVIEFSYVCSRRWLVSGIWCFDAAFFKQCISSLTLSIGLLRSKMKSGKHSKSSPGMLLIEWQSSWLPFTHSMKLTIVIVLYMEADSRSVAGCYLYRSQLANIFN